MPALWYLVGTPYRSAIVRWNAHQAAQFASTWSTVPSYIAATGRDPIPELEATIERAFGGPDVVRELHFPLYVRATRC